MDSSAKPRLSMRPRLSVSSSRNNIFRRILGERKQDYVTDAPQIRQSRTISLQYAAHLPQRQSTNNPLDASDTASNVLFHARPPIPRRRGFLYKIGLTSSHRYRVELLLRSYIWSGIMFLFILVLLFGAPVRDLWIPMEYDSVFDSLFMITFALFTVDCVLRSIVDPMYCSLGSILFWGDIISTLFLLFEISYINERNFRTQEITIPLNELGIPRDGIRVVPNHALIAPAPIALEVLVVIGKSARVSRLVRSSLVAKISSKVNWFRLLQLINPFWVYESCSRKRQGVRHESVYNVDDSDGDSLSHHSSHFIQPSRQSMSRRTSWGNLGVAILAVVKAQRLAREAEELKGRSFFGKIQKWLRSVGVLPNNDQEWKRHLAACKIQRCWRKAMAGWEMEQAVSRHSHYDGWGEDDPFRGISSKGLSAKVSDKGPARSNRYAAAPQETKKKRKKSRKSHVGNAMRELTVQRVAIGIILALVFSVIFTYIENNVSRESTMVVLHSQTPYPEFALDYLDSARASSIPELIQYKFENDTYVRFNGTEVTTFDNSFYYDYEEDYNDEERVNPLDLRARELLRITVENYNDGSTTVGLFNCREERVSEAVVELMCTLFILLVWLFGMTAFTGPVMLLVVIPIERMVRLLGMLMVDPLGYQSSARYKKFVDEEDEFTKNTRWTNEVLKGMETSFLMSTILRIGSLMKIGFGSAGVDIIRQNLDRGQSRSKNNNIIGNSGSKVYCIFLFCDIRQFTDATESLQEEVFKFTNSIAAVVHSYCHLFGGSANKNVGDAFLLSWILDSIDAGPRVQADKALISVVKICIALYYDNYYIENISETAKNALLEKLVNRKGPIVQMGFGLHAGQAVQGAIGSERKIDATYLSEAVEMAEFLESSTKQYGLKMLMSNTFHQLLDYYNRRRCRKIDQIVMVQDDDEDGDEDDEQTRYDLLTLDLDIDALFQNDDFIDMNNADLAPEEKGPIGSRRDSKRMAAALAKQQSKSAKASSRRIQRVNTAAKLKGIHRDTSSNELHLNMEQHADATGHDTTSHDDLTGDGIQKHSKKGKLVLPKGQQMYRDDLWKAEHMRAIRKRYEDFFIIKKYHAGLRSFYGRDWNTAKENFQAILDRYEDGPSRYFMNQIEKNNGKPPKGFTPYAKV